MNVEMNKTEQMAYNLAVRAYDSIDRKHTNEPYINHCVRVGIMAREAGIMYGFEIGVLHKVAEFGNPEYISMMRNLPYHASMRSKVFNNVISLSDHFRGNNYPFLNREERKVLDAYRISNVYDDVIGVKMCSIIEDLPYIMENEPVFGVTYLREKKNFALMCKKKILSSNRSGILDLYSKLREVIAHYSLSRENQN